MLSAMQAMVILNSELKCWCLLLWNLLRGLCLSSDLRGWWHLSTQECLLPAPSFSPLCPFLIIFPSALHHLGEGGRSKWNLGSILLILSVNPNEKFAVVLFPYAAESNCLELVLPQAMEVIPVSWTQFQIFIPQFCVKINWATFSSHSPNRQVSSCMRNIYLFQELDSLLY